MEDGRAVFEIDHLIIGERSLSLFFFYIITLLMFLHGSTSIERSVLYTRAEFGCWPLDPAFRGKDSGLRMLDHMPRR